MMEIDVKYREIIRESLSDSLYRISLDLSTMKGGAMTERRKMLSKKQRLIEEVLSKITE